MLPRNNLWWFGEVLRKQVAARFNGDYPHEDKRLRDNLIAVIDDWQRRVREEAALKIKRAEIRKLSAQLRAS